MSNNWNFQPHGQRNIYIKSHNLSGKPFSMDNQFNSTGTFFGQKHKKQKISVTQKKHNQAPKLINYNYR